MDVRDRAAVILVGVGAAAAFAGAWLEWSLGIALLVVAAVSCGVGVMFAVSTPGVREGASPGDIDTGTDRPLGEAPAVARVAHPLAARMPQPKAS